MIRSIPNPPMEREDIERFHKNIETHLRGPRNAVEKKAFETQRAEMLANANKIIANSGGRNPLLGN